jgi:hypothetical protein
MAGQRTAATPWVIRSVTVWKLLCVRSTERVGPARNGPGSRWGCSVGLAEEFQPGTVSGPARDRPHTSGSRSVRSVPKGRAGNSPRTCLKYNHG